MAASDPTQILLTHNLWATHQLLDACADLTDDQMHRHFDIGPGSLHDTITHILGAMERWSHFLAGREMGPRYEDGRYNVDQLRAKLDQLAAGLQSLADNHALDEIVTGARGGKTYSFTRGGVLTHVTTHGMHHRAQCINMLRQLGVENPPPSAVVEWILMADRPA